MRRQSGQALVLVLLSLAVVLTIVLFILARSTTDIAVSSRSEEATRAFSAAEAGIENSLVVGTGGSGSVGTANYSANVTSFADGVTSFNYPIELNSGDSMNVWFMSHDANANPTCSDNKCFYGPSMSVCWGKQGISNSNAVTPAIEISILYENTAGDPATIRIARAAFDPNANRAPGSKFTQTAGPGCTIGGANYAFTENINFADLGIPAGSYGAQKGLIFARMRMFYNTNEPQPVGVTVVGTNGSTLPSQGVAIDSTGTAGQSNRRVQVFQGWPDAPEVFDFSIYSPQGLVK